MSGRRRPSRARRRSRSCTCRGGGLLSISGRQFAHDLLRRVLLSCSHIDVEPSCPQRGPQDSQTTWISYRRHKGATVSPGCIYIDPPDPEGRIRISAAVTGELPGQALSVVFAVRPDDEVPAVRADPPSLGGKMLGEVHHIVV